MAQPRGSIPTPSTQQASLASLLAVAAAERDNPLRFARYENDPVGFCRDVLGVSLWAKQRQAIEMTVKSRRVAIRSGHGVGKSFAMACLALWWFYARRGRVIVTGPTKKHVEDVLWGEIHGLLRNAPVYLPPGPAGWDKTNIAIDPTWYLTGVTTDQPGAFQGRHHPRLLLIGDEAAGLSEQTMLEMDTCAVGAENCIVLIGNPTQTSGTFYEAFRKKKDWKGMKISCLEHPNVIEQKELIRGAITTEQVEKWRRQWGEQHPFWFSRVLGDFPAISERGVIPVSWVEQAQNDEELAKSVKAAEAVRVPRIGGLDVARYGDNRCVLIIRRGDAVEAIFDWGHTTLTETAGMAKRYMEEWGLKLLVIDSVGLGAGVYDIMNEQGLAVAGFNAGHRAFNPGSYMNRRAELWWHLRQRFEKKRLWLPQLGEPVERLVSDLTAPLYEINSTGRIKIESKENLLDRGILSPDFADALVLCFAADEDPEEELVRGPAWEQDPQPAMELLQEGEEQTFPQLPLGF